MTERKVSKRRYMTVVESGMCEPTRGFSGEESIYTIYQYFSLRRKHLKGSNRPAGWFHGNQLDGSVTVRWLFTERNQYFAPEITFRPPGLRVASKVAHALKSFGYDKESPEALCVVLYAFGVEYVTDEKEGCWDDYRLIRDYSENAMMTLARAAQ